MQPFVPSINVDSEAEVQRSCNCCNGNVCESECCCFPFFRVRRRHSNKQVQQAEKVHEIAKEKLSVPKK